MFLAPQLLTSSLYCTYLPHVQPHKKTTPDIKISTVIESDGSIPKGHRSSDTHETHIAHAYSTSDT